MKEIDNMSQGYAIGLYEKAMPSSLSWKDKLRCAQECGYDFVEISIDETDEKLSRLDWTSLERREFSSMMADVGLPVRSMCLSGHRKYPLGSADPATRDKGMEIMEKAIRLADDIGVRIIQLAGYDVYYETSTRDSRLYFEENLAKSVDMAARYGVLLGFETMETEFMNTVAKSMKYVGKINSPYLGVYPDAGNLTNAAMTYGTSVLDDLETGRGHIVALHLKETAPGKFREVPFFTGHVEFEAIIRKAKDLGIRRFVTEMWDVGSESWKEDIIEAVTGMKKILDSVF